MLLRCFFINMPLLFPSTLSAQSNPDGHVEKRSKLDRNSEDVGQSVCRLDIQRLEEILQAEREERDRLEREKEKLRQEKEILEEQRDRERGRGLSMVTRLLLQFDQTNQFVFLTKRK